MNTTPEYQWMLDAITCFQKIEEGVYKPSIPGRMLRTREEIQGLIDGGMNLINKSGESL